MGTLIDGDEGKQTPERDGDPDEPEQVALERRVSIRGCAEQDEAHTAERDHREDERTRVVVLAEELGTNGHDEEWRERTDQRCVGNAVVRRAGEEGCEVQSEE